MNVGRKWLVTVSCLLSPAESIYIYLPDLDGKMCFDFPKPIHRERSQHLWGVKVRKAFREGQEGEIVGE